MERFDEFSSIEQAAMEQSPAHETDVGHNFYEAQSFIGKVVHDVGHAVDKTAHDVGHVATKAAHVVVEGTKEAIEVTGKVVQVATPETPEAEEATAVAVEVAAGGVVVDNVFTKEHISLLKSVDKECSIDELIDLRSSLMRANKMLKK
ncbi:hypothetical protein GCM10011344_30330 [Dokdonia pacifica]|uniref:Uncharacterized protein n=1 Tax=Dokdonia pacifica TaxID=1627892 RepID=A0A239BXF9_9FLAO|nr:hypothetical protein [Dokdonia pacifica]GGG27439.1 hypothetical protein GCM10011344_30330 [Dokdonia pacifica]SNS12580.1 hypothetical protein SAMN06265376_1078 [Dokdonia pacifica]